jgi:hypothetical protein
MILESGEKLHVIMRRNFDNDLRRHFIGEVIEVDGVLARVAGYAFVFDNTTGQFVRRRDMRTRIIGLADAGNIVNVIPPQANIENARYKQSAEGKLVVTDDQSFSLDINEFGTSR